MPPPRRAVVEFGIDYRPETESDRPFIAALYGSTRALELAGLGWPTETLASFLQQQHLAQHRHFRTVYPDGEWLIIEQSGHGIGRLYLNEAEEHLRLVDIILRPESRASGIGTAIVTDLIAMAHDAGKSLRLTVDKSNPAAARLYRRLGFETIEVHGMHESMTRPRGSGA